MRLELVLTDDDGIPFRAFAENITVEDLKRPLGQFVKLFAHPLTGYVFHGARRKWIDNNPPPGM